MEFLNHLPSLALAFARDLTVSSSSVHSESFHTYHPRAPIYRAPIPIPHHSATTPSPNPSNTTSIPWIPEPDPYYVARCLGLATFIFASFAITIFLVARSYNNEDGEGLGDASAFAHHAPSPGPQKPGELPLFHRYNTVPASSPQSKFKPRNRRLSRALVLNVFRKLGKSWDRRFEEAREQERQEGRGRSGARSEMGREARFGGHVDVEAGGRTPLVGASKTGGEGDKSNGKGSTMSGGYGYGTPVRVEELREEVLEEREEFGRGQYGFVWTNEELMSKAKPPRPARPARPARPTRPARSSRRYR